MRGKIGERSDFGGLGCANGNNLRFEIERLISIDDKDGFVSFVRNHQKSSGFSVSDLFKLILLHRAVGCGTALLEGDTGLDVYYNVLLDEGLSPLHIASQSLSYGLTKLFLTLLESADFLYGDGSNDFIMLPLGAALEAISHHEYVTDWTPKKSVFKLFYIFCLPELKEPLDTVKLLASSTAPHNVKALSKCCVKEGKVVQLAALSLVALDKLDVDLVKHCISEELKAVEHELKIIMAEYPKSKLSQACKCKKINLECATKMLFYLSKAHHVIESYRNSSRPKRVPKHEVPLEVALKLKVEARVQFKKKDVYSNDIKCLRPQLETKVKACSKEHMHSGPLLGNLARKRATGGAYVPSSSSNYLPSHSFHTHGPCVISANVTNHQLVRKPPLPKFLQVATICVRLITATKRCL